MYADQVSGDLRDILRGAFRVLTGRRPATAFAELPALAFLTADETAAGKVFAGEHSPTAGGGSLGGCELNRNEESVLWTVPTIEVAERKIPQPGGATAQVDFLFWTKDIDL